MAIGGSLYLKDDNGEWTHLGEINQNDITFSVNEIDPEVEVKLWADQPITVSEFSKSLDAYHPGIILPIFEKKDEYHSMDDLYYYRMLYNALAFNEWAKDPIANPKVCKSWRESDGNECFGGGWFIVVAELPTGQISNHYSEEYWELFKIPVVGIPPRYDGHTPEEAAERMKEYLES